MEKREDANLPYFYGKIKRSDDHCAGSMTRVDGEVLQNWNEK
jgi:hypothetical protein